MALAIKHCIDDRLHCIDASSRNKLFFDSLKDITVVGFDATEMIRREMERPSPIKGTINANIRDQALWTSKFISDLITKGKIDTDNVLIENGVKATYFIINK